MASYWAKWLTASYEYDIAQDVRKMVVGCSRGNCNTPHCCIASCAQPKGLSNTFYMTAQPCAASVAISKVAALVEEYKLVAAQFKGKKKTDPEPEPEPAPEPETPTT